MILMKFDFCLEGDIYISFMTILEKKILEKLDHES